MRASTTGLGATWWSLDLNEIDDEVARLADICHVPLLEPGVVERMLVNDPSVRSTTNVLAFEELRNSLMLHYAARSRDSGVDGEAPARAVVARTVEDLKQKLRGRPAETAASLSAHA